MYTEVGAEKEEVEGDKKLVGEGENVAREMEGKWRY